MKKLLDFEGSDKVALLVTLFIVVGAAGILVNVRNKISFGASIELAEGGVTVALPNKKQWKCEKQWKYKNLYYSISCQKTGSGGQPETVMSIQYNLYSYDKQGGEYLNDKYGEFGILESGTIPVDNINIDWVCFKVRQPVMTGRQRGYQVISRVAGLAQLENSRQLEISILTRGFTESVIRLMEAVAGQIEYSPVKSIERGAGFREKLLASKYSSRLRRSKYYLVKDENQADIGFRLESNENSQLGSQGSILSRAYDMIDAEIAYTNISNLNFVSDLGMYKISGRREMEDGTERFVHEIVYDRPVLKLNFISSYYSQFDQDPVISLNVKNTFLPEHFYSIISREFCRLNTGEIIVDLLNSEGKIIPTRISKVPDGGADCVLVFESLDRSGNVDKIHIDGKGNILRIENVNQGYKVIAVSKEQIEKTYPMWYEVIESY